MLKNNLIKLTLPQLPDDIFHIIFLLLDKKDKLSLSLVNRSIHGFFLRNSSTERLILSNLREYYLAEGKQHWFRNIFYTDKEESRILGLKRDLLSLFSDNPSCSLEFGYVRKYDHSRIDNDTAKQIAIRTTLNNFYSFPFDFNINLYQNIDDLPLEIRSELTGFEFETETTMLHPLSKDEKRQQWLTIIVAVTFRIACEHHATAPNSAIYLIALKQMLRIIFHSLNLQEKYLYLASINSTLALAEEMKERLLADASWNRCYVWRYPNYVPFNNIKSTGKEKPYYQAGYHRVYHSAVSGNNYRSAESAYYSTEKIPGSDSNLPFFFPYRERYEEFTNLQQVYKTIQHQLILNLCISENKLSTLTSYKAILEKMDQFSQDDVDIVNLYANDFNMKERVSVLNYYYSFLEIYNYLQEQYLNQNIGHSLSNQGKIIKHEINDFILMLDELKNKRSIKNLELHISSTSEHANKTSFYFLTSKNEYHNKRLQLLAAPSDTILDGAYHLFVCSMRFKANKDEYLAVKIYEILRINDDSSNENNSMHKFN